MTYDDRPWLKSYDEWVEPEMAAMEQAEMVWEEMERKKVEREEMRREEIEQEEMERKKVEAEGGVLILGIPVYIDDERFRGLLRAALDQIRTRCPADLERIRRRVSRIEPMRPGERPPYVSASYGGLAHGTPVCLVGHAGEPEDMARPIKMSRRTVEGPRAALVETLVHELGHAVSTSADIEVRSKLGREWGSELAADHHAVRWGFGRLIASQRSDRCVAHHGPVPGEEVVVGFGEHRVAWRVTDDRVPVYEGLVR